MYYTNAIPHNVNDREKKGRNKIMRGEQHGRAKLSERDVKDIRELHNHKASLKFLADDYNVAIGTIKDIIYKRNWKHI